MVLAAGRTLDSKIHSLILFGINKPMSEQWKESIIVSIYKKGDKTDCSNYRHISQLTPYVDAIIGYNRCRL
jgi:hypothetical protein